mmetsp:Transcript_29286/g.90595  ORF Transcript_29286/g.90595 Transcript_29286/m.90595 type:complete len:388 (+) Transcript_29286:484-1647(+)
MFRRSGDDKTRDSVTPGRSATSIAAATRSTPSVRIKRSCALAPIAPKRAASGRADMRFARRVSREQPGVLRRVTSRLTRAAAAGVPAGSARDSAAGPRRRLVALSARPRRCGQSRAVAATSRRGGAPRALRPWRRRRRSMRSMRSIMRSALLATAASALEGIRNYRRLCGVAASLPVYRCASLEQATSADVEALRSVALVVDLRNDDEIAKGAKNRTAAAAALYEELGDSSRPTALSQRPLLGDVDAFWTGVAELSPPMPFEQAAAIFTTKPLNDALTRSLEDGGIPMMYKAILLSAPEEVGRAVGEVAACAEAGEPVVFHCQKGKDRTGLVAALVESVCGVPRPEIVAGYAVSGALLGGEAPRGLRGRSRRRRGAGRGYSEDATRG